MTDAEILADTLARRARLTQEARRQAAELRTRQQSGEQRVGPWAPAATIAKPRRKHAIEQGQALRFRKRA